MCLKFVVHVRPEQEQGFGFKVVHPGATPYTFRGYWSRFHEGGGGTENTYPGTHPNRVEWKIGRLYRVKHNRTVEGWNDNVTYGAGVHIYLSDNQPLKKVDGGYNVVLVVKYSCAKWRDDDTIVAHRVTPVLALYNRQELLKFAQLKSKYGFQKAVEKYQETE